MALIDKLQSLGDAVRERSGHTDKMTLDEMAIVIKTIPQGKEPVVEAITITENGTYTAPVGVDGYSPIMVDVAGTGDIPSGEEVKF